MDRYQLIERADKIIGETVWFWYIQVVVIIIVRCRMARLLTEIEIIVKEENAAISLQVCVSFCFPSP